MVARQELVLGINRAIFGQIIAAKTSQHGVEGVQPAHPDVPIVRPKFTVGWGCCLIAMGGSLLGSAAVCGALTYIHTFLTTK